MTTTETTTETMRRAATQMRAGAEAATPGPWEHPFVYEVTRGYHQDGPRHIATWIATADAGDGDVPDEQAQANAEHIASWHPLVALRVAEWLETEASAVEMRGNDTFGHTFSALNVARAYLGETAATTGAQQ